MPSGHARSRGPALAARSVMARKQGELFDEFSASSLLSGPVEDRGLMCRFVKRLVVWAIATAILVLAGPEDARADPGAAKQLIVMIDGEIQGRHAIGAGIIIGSGADLCLTKPAGFRTGREVAGMGIAGSGARRIKDLTQVRPDPVRVR